MKTILKSLEITQFVI